MKRPKYQPKIDDLEVFRRLMVGVEVDIATGCWTWKGHKAKDGYGQVKYQGTARMVHRISWAVFVGDLPAGMTLHHTCRNRACCNYQHLELMTQGDNARESMERKWREKRKIA